MTILLTYIIISFVLEYIHQYNKSFIKWIDNFENIWLIVIFLILALPSYILSVPSFLWFWNWDSENNKLNLQ